MVVLAGVVISLALILLYKLATSFAVKRGVFTLSVASVALSLEFKAYLLGGYLRRFQGGLFGGVAASSACFGLTVAVLLTGLLHFLFNLFFANAAVGGGGARASEEADDKAFKDRCGKLSYLRASLEVAKSLETYEARLTVDGTQHRVRAAHLVGGNCRYAGVGWPAAPRANPEDGLLDLMVIVEDKGLSEMLTLAPQSPGSRELSGQRGRLFRLGQGPSDRYLPVGRAEVQRRWRADRTRARRVRRDSPRPEVSRRTRLYPGTRTVARRGPTRQEPLQDLGQKFATDPRKEVSKIVSADSIMQVVSAVSNILARQSREAEVRIWEHAGPMMHANRTEADGCWARVGSTNLNIAELLANWEIDLVAEDRSFGAEIEAMFEEDLTDARGIHPGGEVQRLTPRLERPAGQGERRVRTGSPKDNSRAVTRITQADIAALQTSGDTLRAPRRAVATAISAGVLGVSLPDARSPRLLPRPLVTAPGLLGGLGLLYAVRPATHARLSRIPSRPNLDYTVAASERSAR